MRTRSIAFSVSLSVVLLAGCGADSSSDDSAISVAGSAGVSGTSGHGGTTANAGAAGVSGASGHAGSTSGSAGAGGTSGTSGHGGASGTSNASGGSGGASGASGHAGSAGNAGGSSGAGGSTSVGGAKSTGGASGSTSEGGAAGSTSEGGASGSTSTGGAASGMGGASSDMPGFTLVWSDEFELADGSAPDPTIWKHDVGGDGWGNQEREYYTDGTENSVIQGGNLVITAKKLDGSEGLTCWYGQCQYSSARLLTAGMYQAQYGRFAARIQIPFGQGVWPAFWMLGANIDSVNWPTCGEIDVMENIGKEPDTVHGTVHGPTSTPGQATNDGGPFMQTAPFSGDFHVFAVDWSADEIAFSVDGGAPYYSIKPSDLNPGETWVFDQPFFLLLNLAIGGSWPGDPDSSTTFPQTMLVDWVRVYTKN